MNNYYYITPEEYEIALKNGFSGSEEEWLISLHGKDGDSPSIGEHGNWYIGNKDTGVNVNNVDLNAISLDNINSPEYVNLLSSINGKELSSEEKENLMYLLMTNNHLDISSFEELKNIDSVRENYINMLIERNTLGSLKTAYFEKTFGIDLATAINLVNLYGKSLESSTIDSLDEKSRSEFILLENMKKIIGLNNLDVLKYYVENINPEFVVKPDLMVTYEARLKYLFTQEFNKSFTKPLQEDKVISNIK